MRVAVVSHNIVKGDGQGRVNVALVRYLLQRDVRVTLVANNVDPGLARAVAKVIHIDTGPLSQQIDLLKVWRFMRKADRVLEARENLFDAVVACGVVCSVPHTVNAVHFAHGGWRRSPFHPIKQGAGLNPAYQWLFSTLNDYWERQTLGQAERIVAVSGMVKDELVASGLSPDTIDVVVNGVDLESFRPGPAERASLRLPLAVPLGLFVGDIRSTIKNPDGVLRAMSDVPDLHLALAGSIQGSPFPALAESLGIQERVHFLDFRRDIADLMRAADFFVLPSRRDSCPLVLLEAMASGLPCIVSKNVGTHDLVAPNAGFVLESPEDTAGLADALRVMRDDVAQREAMGKAARATAEQHSWGRMSQQYLEIIRTHARSSSSTSIT